MSCNRGVGAVLLLIGAVSASAETIPFDSERWRIEGQETRVETYLGKRALYVKGGFALVDDSTFTDGTIDFKIAVSGERGFMGAVWRLLDGDDFEEFYIRPHQSGKPDANQYTLVMNGAAAWQLYHGEGYSAPVEYAYDSWIHIRIVVAGSRAEVYIVDMETPAITVQDLKRPIVAGKVGLINPGEFTHARFADFSYEPSATPPALTSQAVAPATTPKGTIMKWWVSSVFEESVLEGKHELGAAEITNLDWTELRAEPTGITNLARVHGIDADKNTVFARAIVVSEDARTVPLRFGYSDRVRVFLNGSLLYAGDNGYRSRDFRYLGTIGLFDSVPLALRPGDNELVMAVSESFGGWGVLAKVGEPNGMQ